MNADLWVILVGGLAALFSVALGWRQRRKVRKDERNKAKEADRERADAVRDRVSGADGMRYKDRGFRD